MGVVIFAALFGWLLPPLLFSSQCFGGSRSPSVRLGHGVSLPSYSSPSLPSLSATLSHAFALAITTRSTLNSCLLSLSCQPYSELSPGQSLEVSSRGIVSLLAHDLHTSAGQRPNQSLAPIATANRWTLRCRHSNL